MEIGKHHRSWLCTLGSRWLRSYLHCAGFRQGSGERGFALEGTLSGYREENGLQETEVGCPAGTVTALVHVGEMGFGSSVGQRMDLGGSEGRSSGPR